MVHGHALAFQQDADPAPLGTSLRDALPGSGIPKPTPLAGDLLHLLSDLGAIRRAFSPDSLGINTDQPAGPLSADLLRKSPAGQWDAARYHDPASPGAPRLAAWSMSSVLSQQILQRDVVQHDIGQQALEFSVLVFERLQSGGLRHFHPAILGLQLVERRGA